MLKAEVTVSVVTHNSEKYIGALLDSITAHTKGVSFAIVVADNDSKDGTAEEVRRRGVMLIQNSANMGFGRAHNLAMEHCESKYHLIVNPDVYFDTDIISGMAAYLDTQPETGMLTPRVLYPEGKLQPLPKRDPKLKYVVSRRIGLNCLKKYKDEYEMRDKGDDEAFDIEFATGCFMFIRTELLRRVGGFDERFFLYFEDADLSRRIRRYARIEYNPSFTIYHRWERAGAKSIKYFLIQSVSMLKYFRKWRRFKFSDCFES